MTNPSQHIFKMAGNTAIPHGINIRLICAPDVFWAGRVIQDAAEHTVREFRDPACHEVVNIIRNCPDSNGFIPARWPASQTGLITGIDHSRVRVRLGKPKTKVQKPLLELFGQPRTCGKATNEKCELLVINQERCSRIPGYTDRVDGKVLLEVIPDRIHGRLNRGFEERRNLCAAWEDVSSPIN